MVTHSNLFGLSTLHCTAINAIQIFWVILCCTSDNEKWEFLLRIFLYREKYLLFASDMIAFLISIAICIAKILKIKRPNSQTGIKVYRCTKKNALQMQIQTTCRTLPQQMYIALTALSAIHIGKFCSTFRYPLLCLW
jgi:hypothetical protein